MRFQLFAIALGLAALTAMPARADSIDGTWCTDKGKRLMINGPSLTTPTGARVQGNYDRHGFTYVVPAGDPGAGGTVEMRLLGEHAMQSRSAGASSIEEWQRCGPEVS